MTTPHVLGTDVGGRLVGVCDRTVAQSFSPISNPNHVWACESRQKLNDMPRPWTGRYPATRSLEEPARGQTKFYRRTSGPPPYLVTAVLSDRRRHRSDRAQAA